MVHRLCPCIAELPVLNELTEEFSDNNDFLLLSFARDDSSQLADFIREKNIQYEVIPSAGRIMQDTLKMAYAFPTNLLLNRKGEIVYFELGGPLEEEKLIAMKDKMQAAIKDELNR